MSKKGGNCSVNLKKIQKNFSNLYNAVYAHLGITCITMLKPLIYKALRRFYGVMTMDSLVSPSINPYATRVCGVFHWNHGKYTEIRKISIEVRGLCEDYAGDFTENVSHIGARKSTHYVRI